MHTTAERIKRSEKHFSNHIATLHQFDDISTLDWREKNGSSHYYVRYVFDEKHSHLYITGDLGAAVVQLTEKATLETLSDYIENIYYFIKKIQCSTDLYVYDYDTAKAVVTKYLTDVEQDFDEEDEDAAEAYEELMEERKELVSELMENFSTDKGFQVSSSLQDILYDVCPDFHDWLWNAGRNVDERIILWLVGLNMAYQQLNKES